MPQLSRVGLLRPSRRRDTDIRTLLAAPGATVIIFDPSDRSTLFQNSAGTTPVTAPGQAVGLMLDKSQGLVRGPEMVTNGGPGFTDAAGWSAFNGGSAAASGGNLVVTGNGANTTGVYFAFPTVAGNTYYYEVSFTLGTATSVDISVSASDIGGGASLYYAGVNSHLHALSSQTVKRFFTAADALSSFNFHPRGAGLTASITSITIRELPGHHAVQSGATSVRPIYRVDGDGRPYLEFDGIDDWLQTGTITPGTDKAQVIAGITKTSDTARGTVVELTASAASNDGAFHLTAPNAASTTLAFESKGTALTDAVATGITAPATRVLTGLGDIAGDLTTLRVNGVQAAQNTGDQGAGNYEAAALYLGRRGGTSLPFNGHLYGLIVRFGPTLTDAQIAAAEKWMAAKTGVTL